MVSFPSVSSVVLPFRRLATLDPPAFVSSDQVAPSIAFWELHSGLVVQLWEAASSEFRCTIWVLRVASTIKQRSSNALIRSPCSRQC